MGRSSVRGTKKRSQEGLEEKGDEKLSMSPVAHKTKSMSKKTNTKNKRDTSTTSSKRNGRDDFENDDEDNKENDGIQNSLVKQLNDLLEANGFVAEEDVPKDKEALKWKKKYEELYQLRVTEAEKLLEEAKELTCEESEAYQHAIAELEKQVAKMENDSSGTSSKENDQYMKLEKAFDRASEKLENMQVDYNQAVSKNHELQQEIAALKLKMEESVQKAVNAQPSPLSSAVSISSTARALSDAQLKMYHMKKLLGVYQLLSGIRLGIIDEDEDGGDDDILEVACTLPLGSSQETFDFELAIPRDPSKEVDYMPADEESDAPAPFLKSEISFKRDQLLKFTRTLIDIAIKHSE